jgi:molybdenum cofactor cytidylyltransferase
MGRDKALLPWPPSGINRNQAEPAGLSTVPPVSAAPRTLLSAAIAALTARCDLVFVVVGKNQPALSPVIDAGGAFAISNSAPERGQLSSLQTGLREVLNRGRDAAIVTLVDRPPPRPDTLTKLVEAFWNRHRDIWAVVPEFHRRHGHPIVIAREMIEAFLRAPVESTAREVEHAWQDRVAYIPVDDGSICININTPEEYAALASGEKAWEWDL